MSKTTADSSLQELIFHPRKRGKAPLFSVYASFVKAPKKLGVGCLSGRIPSRLFDPAEADYIGRGMTGLEGAEGLTELEGAD